MSQRSDPAIPNDHDYWEAVFDQSPLETIRKCEDAARQLISLNSLLSAIYFGAISFNDVLTMGNARPLLLAAFMLPVILWCVGLYFAMRVLIPGPQVIGDDIRQSYEASGQRKYELLRRSYYALLCSMVALLLAVGVYLWLLLPTPDAVTPAAP